MTTSKLNQAEFAAKVKSQRDSINYFINEIKRLVAYRYWPESSYGDKHELFLDELSKTEAQIQELKSQANCWINMQNKDISQIERTISRANGVREKLELQKMNNTKKSEIHFLQEQIRRLNETLNYLKNDLIYKKPTHALFYSYQIKRTKVANSISCSYNKGDEEFYITAHPSQILLRINSETQKWPNLEIIPRFLRAFLKKDSTLFILTTDSYPRELGIGTLLLKALESQLSPGTELSLQADGDSPGFWQKKGFIYDYSTKKYCKRSNL